MKLLMGDDGSPLIFCMRFLKASKFSFGRIFMSVVEITMRPMT